MPKAGNDYIDKGLVESLTRGLVGGDATDLATHFKDIDSPFPEAIWAPAVDDLDEDALRALLTYWANLPRGVRFPLADKLDPMDMKPVLGYLMLLDVIDDGWDYRYRVYGTAIAASAGFDATGKLVSEIPVKPMAPFFIASYRACLEREEFLFTRHVPPVQVHVTSWDRLILPLEDGAGNIIRLLVGNVPGTWRP